MKIDNMVEVIKGENEGRRGYIIFIEYGKWTAEYQVEMCRTGEILTFSSSELDVVGR